MSEGDFWSQPEQVERFAERDPDHRLRQLVDEGAVDADSGDRVLDLGCAGGRNAVFLARRGFDVIALDTSPAMVEETRRRMSDVVGTDEARRRVQQGRMQDLARFDADSFALVVALGVYHHAGDIDDLRRALSESARVLEPGGLLLSATFSPRSSPGREGLSPVEEHDHLWRGFSSGPLLLLDADDLDREAARHGLVPDRATETVEAEHDGGTRVTVNALYRKEAGRS